MEQALLFDEHIAEYEEWFDKYNNVFLSEVAAILELFPEGDNLYGLEIGTGTGRFSEALGIKEGVDPSRAMREKAGEKGINVRDARAEALPFKDMSYHIVLIVFCISYFENLHEAFKEAYRVLKDEGVLILGFIDKNSAIGEFYESRKPESIFYKHANFYSVEKITEELRKVGFKQLSYSQTLFHPLDEIDEMEIPKPGYGEGSFVLIKSIK
jgi:SAM-dependent methyltransferase